MNVVNQGFFTITDCGKKKKTKTNNLHLWLELSAEKNQKPILQDIRASLLCFNIDATVYSDFIGFNLNLKKKPKLLRFFQNKT